jgi:hypothetical protein
LADGKEGQRKECDGGKYRQHLEGCLKERLVEVDVLLNETSKGKEATTRWMSSINKERRARATVNITIGWSRY